MNRDDGIFSALRHGFFWLVFGNAVGLLLALWLVFPGIGDAMSPLTYGRWVPVHLNVQLYGWTSLPLIAWLFSVYRTSTISSGLRAIHAVWAWSFALITGSLSWLSGVSSGKIFLDWHGVALWVFIAAQVVLWIVLFRAWRANRSQWSRMASGSRLIVLLGLLMVPMSLAVTTSPETYPPIDHTTGGPTGASLLGSTLIVVAMMLLLPRGMNLIGNGQPERNYWLLWAAEFVTFIVLEVRGGTHHQWEQILGLALLLPWMLLIPRLWRQYAWPQSALLWRRALWIWWSVLLVLGWIEFLPGILDHMKFTNALVAHSHLAMAGFTSAFVILLAVVLLGEKASTDLRRGVWWWHSAVAGYVIAMMLCGWLEGSDYSWMQSSAPWRTALYAFRLACGAILFVVSLRWYQSLLKNHSL
jgi:cytochrome c oxidase cbb3-type subunit 1